MGYITLYMVKPIMSFSIFPFCPISETVSSNREFIWYIFETGLRQCQLVLSCGLSHLWSYNAMQMYGLLPLLKLHSEWPISPPSYSQWPRSLVDAIVSQVYAAWGYASMWHRFNYVPYLDMFQNDLRDKRWRWSPRVLRWSTAAVSKER